MAAYAVNRDDIIRMAREAGFSIFKDEEVWGCCDSFITEQLERFAALVAASEREACAAIAEKTVCDTHLPTGVKIYGYKAAVAMRARGQQ